MDLAKKRPATLKQKRSNALLPPPREAIAEALGLSEVTVEWLAGDGSDRCYYRLKENESDSARTFVLMQLSGSDADALRADGYDWIKIANLLAQKQIFVPRVVATLPAFAALIIEDYGDLMLESVIFGEVERENFTSVKKLYGECFKIVARFLSMPKAAEAPWCKRSFDEERFVWELRFFMQKYALPVAGIVLSGAEEKQFTQEISTLSKTLAANSKYFVHRDFHSRNVMVKDERLAVIDFQDARLGPAAYDLVSLCFDSYVPLSGVLRSELMQDSLKVISALATEKAAVDAQRLWQPVLLQRQLKAIGSFGFLTIDKQRGDYLQYVGPALKTLEDQNLFDERWPFISQELLRRLRLYLDKSGSA
jgi:aminoglycoside/choline kinase family phosphotransferase